MYAGGMEGHLTTLINFKKICSMKIRANAYLGLNMI